VVEARSTLRLVSAFMDRSGLEYLAYAFAAATARGVQLDVILPTRSTHAAGAFFELRRTIEEHGEPARLSFSALRDDAPWAHLKVLTADSSVAYIGSANMTGAGISGTNLELGVIVQGPHVALVEQILDQFGQRT